MRSRRAARTSGRGRHAAAWGVAVQAALLIVLAGAWPAIASAANSSTNGPLADATAATSPSVRAMCPPAAPGHVACMGLIRTDLAPLARAAVGPLTTAGGYTPSDLRSAYGLPDPSAGNGTGITVAIIDFSDLVTAESDLAAYRSEFGLSPCTTANGCFTKIDEDGGTSYPVTDDGWGGEIALDIEMVSAICPNCHILLVEASSTFVSDLGTAVNTAVSLGAKVVSNSYGGGEYFGQTSDESSYFDHPGVAITASSGDSGFGVQFPASSPHVTSVGGTSLTVAQNARGWSETAWHGAGSGCSSSEPKPGYQHDSGCPRRTVADVSAVANPSTGVAMYLDGGWLVAGGTSVAAPIIAGVYALAGVPTAGTYPSSYPYGKTSQLHDVTSGSNGSCSPAYLCTAAAGYDGPTGLGTPNGTGAFISPLLPGAPTSVSGIGGNTTIAVSWHAAAANGHPITSYSVVASPGGHTCTTAGTLTCTVSGLINGSTYTFRVTAANSIGSGPASAPSPGVIPATVPGAPSGAAATPADSSAVVSWSAPGSTGGVPITGYTATSAPLGRTCTTTGALTCTVVGLLNGTSYTFSVTATNAKGTGPASTASAGVTPLAIAGATYHVVTPNRIVDSRSPGMGLTSGPLLAGHAQTFTVTDQSSDLSLKVPGDAIAVTGNLTVTGQTAAGFFALTQTPIDAPTTSTLNFPVGDNRANGVTVPLQTNGSVGTLSVTYVAKAGATAHVVFDVTGYFEADPSGATYHVVTPNRIVDSRSPGNQLTHLVANTAQTITATDQQLGDATMDIPGDAIAVTGNLTVTGQTAAGYFSLTLVATNAPTTSTLNFPVGDNRANGVTVALHSVSNVGTLGVTYVARAGATAQVLFDMTGYFEP